MVFLPTDIFLPFFCLHKFSWVISAILHCDQIADMLSEHNFTNLEIFGFMPVKLMSFGI